MRNFNTENLALLTEVRKNQMFNSVLKNTSFPAIFDELGENVTLCHLTDAELAVSDVTIERIETVEQLHIFMLKCQRAYTAMHNTHTSPQWLLEFGDNDTHFASFFENLDIIEKDHEVMDVLGAMKTLSILDAENLYMHYLELRADEKTHQGAVQKIQLAYDVNGLLRRILMFNGYKGVEIDAVAGVSANVAV